MHEGPRNIHGTHQIRIHRAGLDLGGPANNPWRAHAAVIQSRLIPRHRPTIVADKHHQRVVIDLLSLQLSQYFANKPIQPANLVIVQRVITTHLRSIRHVRRQRHVFGFRWVLKNLLIIRPVRIERSQPQEERLILGTFLERPHPFTSTALGIAFGGFLKRSLGARDESTHVRLDHFIEPIFHRFAHVKFPDRSGPISRLHEAFGKGDLLLGNRPVQLLGIRLVRISARDDAGATGAAGADGQKRPVKPHSFRRHSVNIWCRQPLVSVQATVIPRHIIGNDQH